MHIVDDCEDAFDEIRRRPDSKARRERGKTLGRGAIMQLGKEQYAELRTALATNDEVEEAVARGEFRFVETAGVMEVVMQHLLQLQERRAG